MRPVKINFLDFFTVQFILLFLRVISSARRHFALASSKYPNLEGLVNRAKPEKVQGQVQVLGKNEKMKK